MIGAYAFCAAKHPDSADHVVKRRGFLHARSIAGTLINSVATKARDGGWTDSSLSLLEDAFWAVACSSGEKMRKVELSATLYAKLDEL